MTTVADTVAKAAETGESALAVTDLDAGYGRTQVLRKVSLEVPPGGVVALLGPNGAGKTTLLKTVCGFLPVTAGTVRLFGEDVRRFPPHKRFARGMVHIPEGRGVFRSLTVRENIALQVGERRCDDAVERAGAVFPILTDRLHQKAGTLSGGQQQMLAMVAAYLRNPRLILVDEASLGLAPLVVEEIFAFLGDVAKSGTALLIVDQFAARVLDIVTTAYVLKQGQIVFAGTAAQLADEDLFGRYLSP